MHRVFSLFIKSREITCDPSADDKPCLLPFYCLSYLAEPFKCPIIKPKFIRYCAVFVTNISSVPKLDDTGDIYVCVGKT